MRKRSNTTVILSTVLLLLANYHIKCTPINYNIWDDGQEQEANNSSALLQNVQNATRENRVLNFFPVPVEEECNANDSRRKGICMNVYECRMQGGSSKGVCALGFGVCCVFTATCDHEAFNNITYFVNPDFPDLTRSLPSCVLKIKKIQSDVAQIKLDFVHFNLGQPNRRTGVCEEDIFTITGGLSKDLTLCGVNSGQHAYLDVDDSDEPITISMNMSRKFLTRLWEIRITQIPFTHRAPSGCLQYYTGKTGVIQTMNFADNGRHLANQDYTICMRQEQAMCSITYEPCDENSFRINSNFNNSLDFMSTTTTTPTTISPLEASTQMTGELLSNGNLINGTQTAMQETTPSPPPPMAEDFLNEEIGSGDGSNPSAAAQQIISNSRMFVESFDDERSCKDGILLPCDNEDFLMPSGRPGDPVSQHGNCNLAHCGNSLCPSGDKPCRVESNVLPFTVGVQFGPSAREESPEDNIGMCLNYQQQPCLV